MTVKDFECFLDVSVTLKGINEQISELVIHLFRLCGNIGISFDSIVSNTIPTQGASARIERKFGPHC